MIASGPHTGALDPPDQSDLARALRARLTGRPPLDDPLPSDDGGRPDELSRTQRDIWLADQLGGGDAGHTMGVALRLRGPLDSQALRRALRAVVDRHETLRTMIADCAGATRRESSGEPVLGAVPLAGRDPAALLAELAGRPFDLTVEPALRAHLVATGPGEHLLLLLVHHVAGDAPSLRILVDDLATAYRRGPLATPAPRYTAVARRHEKRAERADGRSSAYWRDRLAGAPPVLELRCALPRPAHRTHRGLVRTTAVPDALIEAAGRLGIGAGGSLSLALMAAWVAVLRRHSGQDDIVLGTAVDLRDQAVEERTVGPLVNLVPVRVRVDPIASAADLLAATHEALMGALDHATMPFGRLVEVVRPHRTPAHHPVLQTTVDLTGAAVAPLDFGVLHAEAVPLAVAPARVDLALSLERGPAGWVARLVAAADLFTVDSTDRLLDDLTDVLQTMTAAPAVPAAPADPDPPGALLLDAFAAWVAATPAAVAVEDGVRALTYAELDRAAGRLAARLTARGVAPDAPVGVFLDRGVHLLTGLLGTLRAGCAYVPLDPEHPPARTAAVLADAGARFVVTRAGLLDRLPDGLATPVPLDELDADAIGGELAAAGRSALQPARPETTAYVIYTSGSTGRPKGVVVTHANLGTLLHVMGDLVGFGAADAMLAVTTVTFDIAALELFLPLTRGGRVVVAPPEAVGDPHRLCTLMADNGITVLQATPVTWRELLTNTEPGWRTGRLRVALCGGERLPADLARLIAGVAEHAWNVYGPTETTVWSTAHRLDPTVGEPVPIGTPLPGTRAHVMDRQLRPVLPGDPGELCLAGAGVARGYHGRPQLSAERFPPDPTGRGRLYRTGDRVRLRPDGTLEFLGRLDDQLKIRGLRVEPGEIEAAARAVTGVRDAVVTAPAGPDGEPLLCCHVVLAAPTATPPTATVRTETAPTEAAPTRIRAALRRVLPEHLVPTTVLVLDALPLTPSGKVDRRALPAPGAVPRTATPVAPRDDVERAVADVWREVLGHDVSGVDTSLFALGGHSLSAVRIAARLRDRFGVEVSLRRMLDEPTVAGVARVLAGGERSDLPPLTAVGHEHAVPAPLTGAQLAVWQLSRDPRASLAYHVHTTLRVPDDVPEPVLRASLHALTARHCVLRTHFVEPAGGPRQLVGDSIHADITDVTLPPEGVEADLTAHVRRPFHLADAPPVRWRIIRVPGEPTLLSLCAHHVVLDGWSVRLLVRELAALWAGADLPPAPCFAAVARWQQRIQASEAVEGQRRYWRQRLASIDPAPALPYDREPPARPDFRGDVVRSRVPGTAGALARRLGATQFTVLLAAFAAGLRQDTGGDERCLGVPMAARRLPALEDVVGMLVNPVVVRCDLSGDPTFAELVDRLGRTLFAAHAHQELPFADVARDAGAGHGAGRNPLYRTMFGLDGGDGGRARVHTGAAKLDLTVTIAAQEGAPDLDVSWEFATQVLRRSTVEAMAARYAALVAAACADPHRRLSDLAPVRAPRPRPAPPTRPRHRTEATLTEDIVAATFGQVLGVPGVGPGTDFFAAGGHSLLAARAAALLGERLGTRLPPRIVLEHPTVAALAAALAREVTPRPRPAPRHDGRPVLVTGGTGLVGGAVVAELRRRGVRVRVLTRPAARGRAEAVADEVVEGDLSDGSSLHDAARGVSAIVHAAWAFNGPAVNVAATRRLVRDGADRPFVFIGSADVYGRPAGVPIDESCPPPADLTAYARAKVACERLVAAGARSGYALLRPPYVWAPRPYCVWQLRETAAAPVEEAALTGRPLILPPAGRGHAWVDARDLAWVVARCLDDPPSEALDVIGGHFDWRDLAATLIRLRGLDVHCVDGEPTGLYGTHRRFRGTRAVARLGFQPRRRWTLTLAAAVRSAGATR